MAEKRKRVMGALPEKIDVRDYKFKKTPFRSANYPSHFECPIQTEIKDQGSVGSCVAHAAAEILEYHYPDTKMSTNFIYGIHYKLYGSKGPGMWCRTRCKIVTKYGDPIYEFCKGNTEVEKVYEIAEKAFNTPEAMENAKEHKISKYVRVVTSSDIKYSLMEYGPIMGAIMWYEENTLDKETGILHKGSTMDGGHSIVVRGWTEDGWICQNSWGKYWGKNGYFILPWNYHLLEAYAFVPNGDHDDVVEPKCQWICKIINWILNLFN